MPLRFSCPCGHKFKTRGEVVGKRARCPQCGRLIRIPESGTYDTVAEEASPGPGKATAPVPVGLPAEPQGRTEQASGGEGWARVVVADSVAEARAATSTILRDHGYVVIEVADGAQAIELIRKERPSAVVLDVRLDNLSGFQVLQQLRNPANPRNKDIWNLPVVMTTRDIRGRDKQYALSLGVKGFYAKPVQPAILCERLEKDITRQRAL